MSDNIYKRVSNHVTHLFGEYPHPNLIFHNLTHTKKVVERAQEIAAHYQLSEKDTLTIYVAAWFHDTGHLFTDLEKHEEKGIELMREYMLKEDGINEELINSIAGCIMATHLPHQPKNSMEEILCDADTYHFGTKEFKHTNKQVKKEFELRGYNSLLNDWTFNTIDLLEKHIFCTSYCKILLDVGKRKNIEWLKGKDQKKWWIIPITICLTLVQVKRGMPKKKAIFYPAAFKQCYVLHLQTIFILVRWLTEKPTS